MSSGGGTKTQTPATTAATTQKPVASGNAAADVAAQEQKRLMNKPTESSETSILTSGRGILDEPEYKRNLLGAGLLRDSRGQGLG